MSVTDSKANFEARALSLGLDNGVLQLIVSGGVGTIAKFAFVSSFVPGGADETPFVAAIKSLLSRDPTVRPMPRLSSLQRLIGRTALRSRRPCIQGLAFRVPMSRATGL